MGAADMAISVCVCRSGKRLEEVECRIELFRAGSLDVVTVFQSESQSKKRGPRLQASIICIQQPGTQPDRSQSV